MEVVKGDFGFLKDQKEVNVEFDYSKMTLMKEKFTETQYVTNRTKELNEKDVTLKENHSNLYLMIGLLLLLIVILIIAWLIWRKKKQEKNEREI